MRKVLAMLLLLATITCGFLFARPQQAAAAAYSANKLVDYKIPTDVLQVLLDNSSYADGQTAANKGLTPATVTIGDIADLTTISLATRTQNADGTFTSAPNDTVADWVNSATDKSLYDIDANVYNLNLDGKVDASDGPLVTEKLVVNGGTEYPPFNFLMQIIASGSKATTVDLTGVTSKIADNGNAQMLMALFQTNRLPNLQTLILNNDNLGNLTDNWILASTLLGVTSSQRVTTLSLANNGMTNFAEGSAYSISTYLTTLNLAGNDMTNISGTLNAMLAEIVKNNGSTDLSSGTLDANNWNTLNYITTLINSNSGTIALSNNSVNAIVSAGTGQYSQFNLNDGAVLTYLSQMDDASLNVLKDNPKLSASTMTEIDDQINGTGSTAANELTVSQGVDFGSGTIGALNEALTATGTLKIQATLAAGASLTAQVSAWTAGDGSSFAGVLTLPAATNNLWERTNLQATPTVIYPNNSDNAVQIDQELTGMLLTVPADEQAKVRAETYTAQIKWNIEVGTSTTQK